MKMEYTNEVWKPIKGYEGLYEISNLGRIKSLNYNRTGKEKIIKAEKIKNGYLRISLYKNEEKKRFLVHRLVAMAFLEEVPGKDYVDHRNGIRDDNRVENLRWCSYTENYNFELAKKRSSEAQKNVMSRPEIKEKYSKCLTNNPKKSKPVLQYTKDGQFITEYPSISEAFRQTRINFRNISSCCLGRKNHKSAGGYVWRFAS